MVKTEFSVSGMSCGGCESNVETAVGNLDGVEHVEADNEHGTVVVDGEYDEAAVHTAIVNAGYSVSA